MKVLNQTVESVPVSALTLHPRNVNQGDVGAIHESIRHNGFWGTIVAQRSTGHVLAGNHRLRAAMEMGADEVPVAWVDVDDDAALKILLADNRTTRLGQDDPAALAELLQEILAESGTLDGTAFDTDDLDQLLADLGLDEQPEAGDDPGAQVDRADELREKWGTERGQMWAIPSKTVPGKSHRLMCGDSTSAEDVGRLLRDAEPRLMVTDPPYGVDYKGGTKKHKGLAADERGTTIYGDFLPVWSAYLDTKAPLYLWHAGAVSVPVLDALADNGWSVRAQIIWAKNQAQFGALGAQYKQKHEPCFYCYRDAPYWYGPNNEVTVWEHARARVNEHHPTEKPVEVIERAIKNSSQRGDLVAEAFGGGGSTFVASEQNGRVCHGMELNPAFVAVILERLTGMGLEPHRVTRDEE